MRRSVFCLTIWLVGLICSCKLEPGPSPSGEAGRPNFLWITVEDISPRLGCYGDRVARTPALDNLAGEGTRFLNAFTTAGVCAPSRSALITGMYQTSIGTHHMRTIHEGEGLPTPYFAVPPPEVKTFTEYLRRAGYYCTNNFKTDYQFGVPVTAWDDCSRTAHWRNREKDQPFFAVFNLGTTHESRIWPKADQQPITDPQAVELPPYYPETKPIREDLAHHYDNIAAADVQVGELLRQLEEDGLAPSTVVFFFSDHGDGLPRAKRWLYDSGIHVPLIVRWPGQLAAGSLNEQLVSFVDFGPTLLSIAGIEIPPHIQGKAFLGTQSKPPREYIFAARDRIDESYDRVRAVRDLRFKFIRNLQPEKPYVLPVAYRDRGVTMQELLRLHQQGKLVGPQKLWFRKSRPPEELYDLETDPHEVNNLIEQPDYRLIANRLRTAMDKWTKECGDLGAVPEDEMVRSMWPEGIQPVTEKPSLLPPGGFFDAPVTVSVTCPTRGASIAYTTEEGNEAHWLLYSEPITLVSACRFRAKAIRYGYRESEEVATDLELHVR